MQGDGEQEHADYEAEYEHDEKLNVAIKGEPGMHTGLWQVNKEQDIQMDKNTQDIRDLKTQDEKQEEKLNNWKKYHGTEASVGLVAGGGLMKLLEYLQIM